FSSSRDLGASLPLSPRLYPLLQAPLVQDNTVPSHTPLLDVRPRGRNQDKPVRYCVASCINIWDEEARSITSWDPDRRVRTLTVGHVLGLVKFYWPTTRLDALGKGVNADCTDEQFRQYVEETSVAANQIVESLSKPES